MITAVNRNITNPALNYLPKEAYTGGIDFRHSWKERTWYIDGNVEFSHVKGSEEAMLNLQESSARYYQRPDADYVSVDSTRSSLSGYGATFKFGRSSNKRIQFETSLTVRSPGLEFNDIGYMRYSDVIHQGAWVAYYLRDPFSIFNNFYLNTNYWMYWNFSGKLLSTFANTNFNSQFKNRWRMNGNFTWSSENISTSLLRGGPAFTQPGGVEMSINFSTDRSKKINFHVGNYHGLGNENSYRYHEYWLGLNARPLDALSVSFSPSFSMSENRLQYVVTTDLAGSPRYLFGAINQKTAAFTFRLNYTFTPELSLEYYGQPFISAGKYENFKRTTNPDADEYIDRYHVFTGNEISFDNDANMYMIDEDRDGNVDYTLENPDFNFRQFRSNFVVRWEYSPGSTLFLVWSQGRTGSSGDGSFDYGHDMSELFNLKANNVFLIKFSYWFAL